MLPYENLPQDINEIYQKVIDQNVDFVIIDYDLGKQAVKYTGIDVLKNIREQDAEIYIIYLTNKDFVEDHIGEFDQTVKKKELAKEIDNVVRRLTRALSRDLSLKNEREIENNYKLLRKKRFLKYNDSRCKKFLSKDFNRKCAYCKIREGDLAGPESFEKDHFFPIAKGGKDDYENLYYSCVSCNGKAGKSDTWSQTLLDPCKDDIWNVHIKLSENCQIEALTMQGKEYIRTFKLNRKSYVVRRRTIETQQTELREKLREYEEIVAKLLETENFKSDGEFLEKDIDEWKHILDEGANYRMTKNAFDNEIDELIVRKLKKVGEVKEVDEDYDLLYELEYNGETFLCHVAMIDIKIEGGDKIKKYISVDKIRAWESVGVADKVLLIFFNQQDQEVYYYKVRDILQFGEIKNVTKCGYDLDAMHVIEKLN